MTSSQLRRQIGTRKGALENCPMRRIVLDEPGAGRSRVPNALVAGFTVLELLLVLAIAGIVTAVAVPNVDQAMKTYRADFAARQVLTRTLALAAPGPTPRHQHRHLSVRL